MGGMRFSKNLLKQWLIEPALFELRVNLLAGNDNVPEDCAPKEDIPDVSLLSLY
jgi:hypothetical protein